MENLAAGRKRTSLWQTKQISQKQLQELSKRPNPLALPQTSPYLSPVNDSLDMQAQSTQVVSYKQITQSEGVNLENHIVVTCGRKCTDERANWSIVGIPG